MIFFCKSLDLYSLLYQVFCNPNVSLYGKNFWQEILSRELNISRQKIYRESANIFDKIILEPQKFSILVKKISKTIERVKIEN